MKAERRHELKTNTLATALTNLPDTWARWGNKLLLGLIVIALVIVLVRYRHASAERDREVAANSLAAARESISQLRNAQFARMTQDQIASARKTLAADAGNALRDALKPDTEASIRAEALVAQGDLYWQLSTFPPLPAATTRPSLNFEQSNDSLLKQADEAYGEVVKTYPDQTNAVTSARFGLAAIAENRGDWDTAKKNYDSIAADTKVAPIFQQHAKIRIETLDQLRQPAYIAQPATAPAVVAVEPTSQPLTPFLPPSSPATQAATQPVN